MSKSSSLFLYGLLITSAVTAGCKGSKGQKATDSSGYFISTTSESNKRVKDLGLDKASENASYILDTSKLKTPRIASSPSDTIAGKVIKEFDRDAIILLKSDRPWNGETVWDVLQSVGLKWGDGDLFHWENHNRGYGDDQLFSVATSTDPGYFLPEEIKAGRMSPGDLVFAFSIPRNADPENVYPMMVAAVKYCQKRLGGKILDENRQPLDEVKAESDLKQLIAKMKSKGVIPGSYKAMVTY